MTRPAIFDPPPNVATPFVPCEVSSGRHTVPTSPGPSRNRRFRYDALNRRCRRQTGRRCRYRTGLGTPVPGSIDKPD